MDIRLGCSLIFASSLFSHLPAQTVNVWTQCMFDSVPPSAALEGCRQRLMYWLHPGRQKSFISQSATVPLAAGQAKSVGTQQRSKKEFSTTICLDSREEAVIGRCSPQWFWLKFVCWVCQCQHRWLIPNLKSTPLPFNYEKGVLLCLSFKKGA